MPGHFGVMQCGFSIENYQLGPTENNTPIINTQYWFAESYGTKFFNDYIFLSVKENILKRVIVNEMSGSSWCF